MNKLKSIFTSFLWYLGALLEFVSIPLNLAALKDISITYEWFTALRNYEFIEIVYYIVAFVTMLVFSMLVLVSRKNKRISEMMLALLCFFIQVVGMLIVLSVQFY